MYLCTNVYIDAREYVLDHSVWNKIYVLPEEFSLKHTGGKLDDTESFLSISL